VSLARISAATGFSDTYAHSVRKGRVRAPPSKTGRPLASWVGCRVPSMIPEALDVTCGREVVLPKLADLSGLPFGRPGERFRGLSPTATSNAVPQDASRPLCIAESEHLRVVRMILTFEAGRTIPGVFIERSARRYRWLGEHSVPPWPPYWTRLASVPRLTRPDRYL